MQKIKSIFLFMPIYFSESKVRHAVLLSSEIAANENQNYAVYSDFESKVVYLTRGDVIMVKVSVPESDVWHYMVSSSHDRTYFGLVLLRESSEV